MIVSVTVVYGISIIYSEMLISVISKHLYDGCQTSIKINKISTFLLLSMQCGKYLGTTVLSRTIERTTSLLRLRRGLIRCSTQGSPKRLLLYSCKN